MMPSKKSFLAVLLLFSFIPLQAKSFLEYKGEKIKINNLGQSTILKEIREKHAEDEKDDADYAKFHDKEGNFKIPLEYILEKITLPNGQPLINVMSIDDIQNFAKLSAGFPVDLLDTQEFIIQINLADILDNETILENVASALIKKINNKQELLAFLQGKGIIWTVIDQLPDDILENVLKKGLLEGTKGPTTKLDSYKTKEKRIIKWSPNGNHLAFVSPGRAFQIWDKKTGQSKTLAHTLKDVWQLKWLNGKFIAAHFIINVPTARKRTLQIWNLETGQSKMFQGWNSAWSTSSKLLAYTYRKIIKTWNPQTNQFKILNLEGYPREIRWSQNGKLIAMVISRYDDSNRKIIQIWKPETNQSKIFHARETFGPIAWSPNGKLLAYKDGETIRFWNPATGESTILTSRYTYSITEIKWPPRGKFIAFESYYDRTIQIWNLETKQYKKFQGLYSAWSTNSKLFAYAKGKTVRILNLETEQSKTINLEDYPKDIRWSQDGKRLASVSDKTIQIFNPETGLELKKIGDVTRDWSIAWSAHNEPLAGAKWPYYETIEIWFFDLFDNTSFQQAVTILALKTQHKEKIPLYRFWGKAFNLATNEKIFEIIKTLPIKKIKSLRMLGWIKISDKEIENIKKQQEELKQSQEEFLNKQRETWSQQTEERASIPELSLHFERLSDPQKRFTLERLRSVKKQTKNLVEKIKNPEEKKIAQKIESKIFKALILQAKSNAYKLLGQLEGEKNQKIRGHITKQIKKLLAFIKHLGDKRLAEKLEKPLSTIMNQKLIFQAQRSVLKLLKMLARDQQNLKIKAKIMELIKLIEILGNKSLAKRLQGRFFSIVKKKGIISKALRRLFQKPKVLKKSQLNRPLPLA